MKKIISAFCISIFFLACQSVPPSYYTSNAHIEKLTHVSETKLKVITLKDEGLFDDFNTKNQVGVIVATDILNGRKINYLLICPITDGYEVNQGVAINVKQTLDLISAIKKAIENSNLEKIFESANYINFSISPESTVQHINKDYITYKASLVFKYQRKGDISSVDFIINGNVYNHYSMKKIIKLIEKGYEELLKLENVK
jgi:hypothetical protein